MLTYRSHIYALAMEASAAAIRLGLSLSDCVAKSRDPDYESDLSDLLPEIGREAADLERAIDNLLAACPKAVKSREMRNNRGLLRHMSWIKRYIAQRKPTHCAHDPVAIAEMDIPQVLARFNRWYENQAPVDTGLQEGVSSLVSVGELDSALRKAWVYFKTKAVELFGLPESLDGHKLIDALFSDAGKTVGILSNSEREAHLNLFKGLYVLSRNPVGHNDVQPSPEEFDAVLMLLNSTLVKLSAARSEAEAVAQ